MPFRPPSGWVISTIVFCSGWRIPRPGYGHLHRLANEAAIRTANDAVQYKLVDSLKYDDQVKDEFKQRLHLGKLTGSILFHWVPTAAPADYQLPPAARSPSFMRKGILWMAKDRKIRSAAKLSPQPDPQSPARSDGSGHCIPGQFGGGSSLASENIWRELELAKKKNRSSSALAMWRHRAVIISPVRPTAFLLPLPPLPGPSGVWHHSQYAGLFKDKLGITFRWGEDS